jgi:membrane protease YdiL (CAAX protease family)
MPWDLLLILAVLGVVVPWRGALKIRELLAREDVTTPERLAVYASTLTFQWIAFGIVLWRGSTRGITAEEFALVVPDAARSGMAALGVTALLVATQIYSLRRLARLPAAQQGVLGELARKLMPRNLVEGLAFFALAGTVALCEEVIYRGFVFAVVAKHADSELIGAVVSSLFFSVAHLYQGWRGMATTFVVGLILAGTRVWTGSLLPCMAAHLVVDLVAGYPGGRMLRAAKAAEVAPEAEA